jgi:predicted transposase/invertase (TIGR01784 family)
MEYLSPEQFGAIREQRKATYDVHCKTVKGKHFIIEMQMAEQEHFSDRMLYYAGLAIVNQAPKGKVKKINAKGEEIASNWDYEIAGICMVAILDFVMFKEESATDIDVEHIKLIRQRANLLFTDKYEFVTIELPKFRKDLQSLSGILEQWLYTFVHIHSLPKCPEEITNTTLKEVYKEAQINNLTQEEMNTYRQSILEYDDVRRALNWRGKQKLEEGIRIGETRGIRIGETRGEIRGIGIGREEGIKIGETRGIEIGKEQEQIKFVKSCYNANMSISQIAELLNLTEEQITAILTN